MPPSPLTFLGVGGKMCIILNHVKTNLTNKLYGRGGFFIIVDFLFRFGQFFFGKFFNLYLGAIFQLGKTFNLYFGRQIFIWGQIFVREILNLFFGPNLYLGDIFSVWGNFAYGKSLIFIFRANFLCRGIFKIYFNKGLLFCLG